MPQELNVPKIEIEKDEVIFWKREIESSREFRKEEFIKRIQYESLIEYWEGNQKNEFHPSIDALTILNEIYPGFSSIINYSVYQNPTITTKAKTPLADGSLKPPMSFMNPMPNIPLPELMRAALQWATEKYGFKNELQHAMFDLMFAGFACIETNHNITQGQDAYTAEGAEPEQGNIIQKAMDKLSQMAGGQEDVEAKVTEEQAEAKADTPLDNTYLMWWNPLEILMDYRATVFNRSRYVGKEKDITLAEFKKDYPDYAEKVREASSKIKYSKHTKKDNINSVKVTELQIKKKDGLYILHTTDQCDEALQYYKYPIPINGFTIKYGCIDKYGKLYPMSRAMQAKKPQDELNHYATIQMEHADRSQKKVGVFMGGLTPEGKNAVKSSDVYAIVEKSINAAVFEQMPTGGVDPANKDLQNMNLEAINKVIGSNELAKSGQSESEFATQDQLKAQAFSSNSAAVQDALGDIARQNLDTLKDIIMALWDGEYYFRITGIPGGEQWYTPEMGKLPDILQGDYLVDVDIISAQRPNPMKDRQEMNELVQALFSPGVAGFLMSNGVKPSIALIHELIKSYNKNPRVLLEEVQMPMPPPVGMNGIPPQAPNVTQIPQGQPTQQPPEPANAPLPVPM